VLVLLFPTLLLTFLTLPSLPLVLLTHTELTHPGHGLCVCYSGQHDCRCRGVLVLSPLFVDHGGFITLVDCFLPFVLSFSASLPAEHQLTIPMYFPLPHWFHSEGLNCCQPSQPQPTPRPTTTTVTGTTPTPR